MIGRFEIDKIYNEDCYKAIKDIPDKSIDCVYVDIPYLFQGGGAGTSEVAQRILKMRTELQANEIYDGCDLSILPEFVRVLKNLNCFIWCSKEQIYPIMDWFMKNTDCTYQILCWCKTNPTPMCNGTWLSDIEYCLWFNRGTKLNDGIQHKSKWYASPINKRDKDKFAHPTIKPLELVKRHLLHATQPDSVVLDCFMGSGTTAVACAETGRHYLGFEVNKKWYDVAVNRLDGVDANGQQSMFLR